MTCSGHPTPSRNLLRKHRGDKDGQRPSGNYPEAKRWVDVCFEGLLVRLFIFLLQFKRVNLKLCTSENCLRPELLHSAPPGMDQCSKAVGIHQAQFWLTPGRASLLPALLTGSKGGSALPQLSQPAQAHHVLRAWRPTSHGRDQGGPEHRLCFTGGLSRIGKQVPEVSADAVTAQP